ncbi:uracil nucleotide/cysteinyl leukotriene receptor-like [Protopterus annectens]|uniref:uracil nucleotide/cysteinyl leukotriene receptor-like n=1 Tax=Protopterus annectens TaxID=7888 RepID=UPI001CF93DE1|nr:uracil nucleotide/cysteinyl leukotriene receptor-like [Protopterus annectens]
MNASFECTYFWNVSSEDALSPFKTGSTENILFATFYIVDFILAFLGNATALWIFLYHRQAGSPANIFLMHLAIADIVYVMVLPMKIVYHLQNSHWPFGEALCCITGFLSFLNMYASLYVMACISVDRLLAAVFPLKSIKIRKPLVAHITCIALWLLLIMMMAPMLGSTQTAKIHNTIVCFQLYREKFSKKAIFSIIVGFAIPFFTTVCSYLLIIYSLLFNTHQMESSLKNKVVKMIILVLLIYFICFVPYHISRLNYVISCTSHHQLSWKELKALSFSNRITSCLTSLNPLLDPIMYFFLAEKFKDTLQKLCRRQFNKLSISTS